MLRSVRNITIKACVALFTFIFIIIARGIFLFGDGLVTKQCTLISRALYEVYLAKIDSRIKQIIFVFGEIKLMKLCLP
jgi:hypothetical protein